MAILNLNKNFLNYYIPIFHKLLLGPGEQKEFALMDDQIGIVIQQWLHKVDISYYFDNNPTENIY